MLGAASWRKMIELVKEENRMKVVYNNQGYDYLEFKKRIESNGFAKEERIVGFVAPSDEDGGMRVYNEMNQVSNELEVCLRKRSRGFIN